MKVAKFEKVTYEQFEKDAALEIKESNDIKGIYNDILLPKRATFGSAGYDFFAPYSFTLKPSDTILIPTGIKVKIEDGWFLALFPRSGQGSKYRLQLDNTVGISDSDYYFAKNEGHILVKITNDSKSEKTLVVNKGQGFVQGIFLNYGLTEDDSCDEKREFGFGSTTK